jgi:hypothetical protein
LQRDRDQLFAEALHCSKRASSGGPTRASSVSTSCRNRATAMRPIHGKSRYVATSTRC